MFFSIICLFLYAILLTAHYKMNKTIEHSGIVTHIGKQYIQVSIVQQSACSACHANKMCLAAESKEKIIEVENDNYNVHEGDTVTLIGDRAMGFSAVLWAFVVPLLLILFTLLIADFLKITEILAASITAGIIAVYYLILYFFKDKFRNKFKFRIT